MHDRDNYLLVISGEGACGTGVAIAKQLRALVDATKQWDSKYAPGLDQINQSIRRLNGEVRA